MSGIYNIEKNNSHNTELLSSPHPISDSSISSTNSDKKINYNYKNLFFYLSLFEISVTGLLTLASPFVVLSLFFAMGMEELSGLAFNFHTLFFIVFMLSLILYPFVCIGSIYVFYKHFRNKNRFNHKQFIQSSIAIIYGLLILACYYFLLT